jgi:PAS domain S-box-containing protein
MSREPGEPSAIRAGSTPPFETARIHQQLFEGEAQFWLAFHDNPAAIVICCGPEDRIQYANDATSRTFGYPLDELVDKPVAVLGIDPSTRSWLMEKLEHGSVRDVEIQGRTRSNAVVDLLISITRVNISGESLLLGIGIDLTDRKRTEAELRTTEQHLRRLTARLMQAQDDERRRVSRSLHETTAQDVASLKMLLSRVRRTTAVLPEEDRRRLDEAVQLTDRITSDIRTVSYLMHPPLLEEAGVVSAIRWYAGGFSRRSGIAVDLDLPLWLPRMARETETIAFRVVQEAMLNVHQHAHSPDAVIRLRLDSGRLLVAVEDHGSGVAPGKLAALMSDSSAAGVGIAGIRERLQQVGGTLEMSSRPGHTVLTAAIPFSEPDSPQSDFGDPVADSVADKIGDAAKP